MFGAYEPRRERFYWKSTSKGNTQTFKEFLHQLRTQYQGKTIIIILDNSSVHNNAKIRKFVEKFPEIKLINLPTHSPEYNPIEQLWKWIKTRIQGAKTLEDGCKEILQRIRKLTSDWLHNRLIHKPHIGLGIWKILLANYL